MIGRNASRLVYLACPYRGPDAPHPLCRASKEGVQWGQLSLRSHKPVGPSEVPEGQSSGETCPALLCGAGTARSLIIDFSENEKSEKSRGRVQDRDETAAGLLPRPSALSSCSGGNLRADPPHGGSQLTAQKPSARERCRVLLMRLKVSGWVHTGRRNWRVP